MAIKYRIVYYDLQGNLCDGRKAERKVVEVMYKSGAWMLRFYYKERKKWVLDYTSALYLTPEIAIPYRESLALSGKPGPVALPGVRSPGWLYMFDIVFLPPLRAVGHFFFERIKLWNQWR